MKQQETCSRYRGEFDSNFQRAVRKLQNSRKFSSEDCEPCRVAPGLFIGSLGAAKNLPALHKEGITHILNASPIVPCYHRRHFRYKVVSVYDDAQEDISQHFEEANKYIDKGRRKGGVLVHCYAGMSRSATFILAYLVACEGMSLGAAMQATRAARPCIKPNPGFMMQLVLFSKQLGVDCALLQYVFNFAQAETALPSGRLLLEYKSAEQEAVQNECNQAVF
jgi:protein-tyrosine phosphatase